VRLALSTRLSSQHHEPDPREKNRQLGQTEANVEANRLGPLLHEPRILRHGSREREADGQREQLQKRSGQVDDRSVRADAILDHGALAPLAPGQDGRRVHDEENDHQDLEAGEEGKVAVHRLL
jgi:hypothetical protein